MIVRRSSGVVVLVLLAAAATAPAEAASPLCAIDITVTPSEREAAVNSTNLAAVTFNGNYTVDKPSFERAQVSITAVIDQAWVATVSPASITVTNVRTGPFTVTVVVPAGTYPTPLGVLTVTGRMIAGGIQCTDEETGLLVKPLPYFDGLSGRMDPTELELKGGTSSLTLTLGAKASVPVSVTLELKGPDGLSLRGVAAVALPAPSTGPVNSTVKVQLSGPDVAPGTYQIKIHVRGTTAEGLTQELDLPAGLTVPENSALALSSPWVLLGAAGAAAAGAVVFFWRRRQA